MVSKKKLFTITLYEFFFIYYWLSLKSVNMWYVYIIKSKVRDWRYVGYTSDLKNRFKQHNEGKSAATRSYKPFKLVSYTAVQNKNTAIKLEKYFKSGSGIAWMNKHLMPGG